MENAKDKVLQLLQDEKIRHLYANTYYSLHDRITYDGYIEEPIAPSVYSGDFGRTSGAYSLMMAEFGNLDLAERALRYVLDAMFRNNLTFAPHVLGKFIRKPNGETEQYCETINQLDATGHILLAYATLVLDHGKTGLVRDYWSWLPRVLDISVTQPNFCGDPYSDFDSMHINLFFNSSLEHTREFRYWSCFDILTQSFMGAALDRFIQLARKLGDNLKADFWQERMDMFRQGMRDHLTEVRNGKLCYAEMRLPDSNTGRLYDGIGWLSLSPLAADWDPISEEVTNNTARAVRDELWIEDPTDSSVHYLDLETQPDGKPAGKVLGKQMAWDMMAALRQGDFEHLYDVLKFIRCRHDADVYGEFTGMKNGKWTTWENGNGEQCVWWCRAMGRLRRALGLSAMPDRADVTRSLQDEIKRS